MRRCRYCAFVSSVYRPVPSEEYADAVLGEFASRVPAYLHGHFDTLYFGGGTPTTLTDSALGRIIDGICSCVGRPSEVTLEANPEHVTPSRARAWKSMGITRVSLGTQSFDPAMLAFLGRGHSPAQAVSAVRDLRSAHFDEISLDLIYGGLPDARASVSERVHRWKSDLDAVRALAPAHVSCYELILEPHTPLWTRDRRGSCVRCGDEAADMMEMIPDVLGMPRYEISNYCRDGYFSSHNVSCWAGLPYLGLGPGAHSLEIGDAHIARRANSGSVREYLSSWRGCRPGAPFVPEAAFEETLSRQMHLAERLICAARTRFFWSAEAMAGELGADIVPFERGISRAVRDGLLERTESALFRTTRHGILLNNRLDEALFEGAPEE